MVILTSDPLGYQRIGPGNKMLRVHPGADEYRYPLISNSYCLAVAQYKSNHQVLIVPRPVEYRCATEYVWAHILGKARVSSV